MISYILPTVSSSNINILITTQTLLIDIIPNMYSLNKYINDLTIQLNYIIKNKYQNKNICDVFLNQHQIFKKLNINIPKNNNTKNIPTDISNISDVNSSIYDIIEIISYWNMNLIPQVTDDMKDLNILTINDKYNLHSIFSNIFNTNIKLKNIDIDINNINDTNISINNCNNGTKYDVIILNPRHYDNLNDEIINLLLNIWYISYYQTKNGNCILYVSNLFYKPFIEILYIFSNIYEQVIIEKTSISNNITSSKYIICKNFNNNSYIINHIYDIIVYLRNRDKKTNITSILSNKIPNYYFNKIVEINTIFGVKQIKSINQQLNILINNKTIDNSEVYALFHNKIQKYISWCDKYNIKYDNININEFIESM